MNAVVGKHLIAWLGLMVLAILNGLAREAWITPRFELATAHQISTITLLALFAGYFLLLAKCWPLANAKQAWMVGGIWCALTLVFEFGFGYAAGKSTTELLSRYAFWTGDMWGLIPLAVLVGPYLAWRSRR